MVRPMATLLKMIPMTGGVIASAAQGNWQVEEAAYNARDPRDQGTGGKTFCGCG